MEDARTWGCLASCLLADCARHHDSSKPASSIFRLEEEVLQDPCQSGRVKHEPSCTLEPSKAGGKHPAASKQLVERPDIYDVCLLYCLPALEILFFCAQSFYLDQRSVPRTLCASYIQYGARYLGGRGLAKHATKW